MSGLFFRNGYIVSKKTSIANDIKKAGYRANGQWEIVDADVSFAYDLEATSSPIDVKFNITNSGSTPMSVDQVRLYTGNGPTYDYIASMDVDIEDIDPGASVLYVVSVDLFSVEYNAQKTGYYDKIGG